MMKFLAVLLLLTCSSCVQIGSDPPPMRYYLLQPNATAEPLSLPPATAISLDPIRIAAYLDRPQLTTRNAEQQVIIAALDRWAEPLEDNLNRVLIENLARHLPTARINSQQRHPSGQRNFSLKLTVNSFDGILGQHTDIDIRWEIVNLDTEKPIEQGHFTDKVPMNDSYSNLVQALNSGLDKLSRQLAQVIAGKF